MKINKKFIYYLTILLLVSWCVVIFCFSAATGDVSSDQSSRILMIISYLGLDGFIPEIVKGASIGTNIRKLAHMTEYAILEILNYLFLYQVTRRKFIRISRIATATSGSAVLSFVYACLDEYHQTFVPGRGGAFADVLIDMRGALAGLIISTIFVMILYVYRYIKYKNYHLLFEK